MADAFKIARQLEHIQKYSTNPTLDQLTKITPQTPEQEALYGQLLNKFVTQTDSKRGKALIQRAKHLGDNPTEAARILQEIAVFESEVALPARDRRDLEKTKRDLRGVEEKLLTKEGCCSYSARLDKEITLEPTIYSSLDKKERAEMAFYLYEMAGVLLILGDKQQFFSLYNDLPHNIKESYNLIIHSMGACLTEFTITLDLTRAYNISRQLAEAAVRTGYFVANGDDIGQSARDEVRRMEEELPEFMEPTSGDVIQAKFA